MVCHPTHRCYFDSVSIKELLQKNKFTVEKIEMINESRIMVVESTKQASDVGQQKGMPACLGDD